MVTNKLVDSCPLSKCIDRSTQVALEGVGLRMIDPLDQDLISQEYFSGLHNRMCQILNSYLYSVPLVTTNIFYML